MKKDILFLVFSIWTLTLSAQSVGINNPTPDASAALDVTSTTQGMLIPRMDSTQRSNIITPAQGLMVYQTNKDAGFYYFDGSAWTSLNGGGAADGGVLSVDSLYGGKIRGEEYSMSINEFLLTSINQFVSTNTVSPTEFDDFSFFRIVEGNPAPSLCNIWGIPAGYDGKLLYLYNNTSVNLTVHNNFFLEPDPKSRILTLTGADIELNGEGLVTMMYDGAQERWIVINVRD